MQAHVSKCGSWGAESERPGSKRLQIAVGTGVREQLLQDLRAGYTRRKKREDFENLALQMWLSGRIATLAVHIPGWPHIAAA